MAWPALNELQEALQHPARAFTDQTLRRAEIAKNRLGLPLTWSGNFAAVFRVDVDGYQYAVRCFTQNSSGKQKRYEAIDRHLKMNGRPATFVEFDYQETGLICRGQQYPLIKMPWIHGQTLDEFTYDNIDRVQVLEHLAGEWYQAATELQRLPIAHNDLQHGNVIVEPGSRASIKLVDYDGLYVPQFANQDSPETGHRHYQHPGRDQTCYGPDVDNFPALVIYTSLIALAHDPNARLRRATPESLLFSQQDLQDPRNSRLFEYLKRSPDPQTAHLATVLHDAAIAPVAHTPTLDQISVPQVQTSLPSWLHQPQLPTTQPWQSTFSTSIPATRPDPSQTTVSPPAVDPAQHNRNLIDERIQEIGRTLKPTVIQYAKDAQKDGWRFQSIYGITGKHIRSLKDLDSAGPDAGAFITVLQSIMRHKGNNSPAARGITQTTLDRVKQIRDEHAHATRDFSDQDYIDSALSTLTTFRKSIDNLPRNLPTSRSSNRGQVLPPANTPRSYPSAPQPHSSQTAPAPTNRSQSQQGTTQQTPISQPRAPFRAHPALARILACFFLLFAICTLVIILLMATPRIILEDWSSLAGAIGFTALFGILLWKTTNQPVEHVTKEIRTAARFAREAATSAYLRTDTITDKRIRWSLKFALIAAPVVAAIGIGMYLSTPDTGPVQPISTDPTAATATEQTDPASAPPTHTIARTSSPADITYTNQVNRLGNQYANCKGDPTDEIRRQRFSFFIDLAKQPGATIQDLQKIVEEECPNSATTGSVLTSTLARVISPEDKTLTFDFDPTQWDGFSLGMRGNISRWHEHLSTSPDLLQLNIEIVDAKSSTWTLSSIEKISKYYQSSGNVVGYNVYLTNHSGAVADFNGYRIELIGESDVYNQNSWHPVHNGRPIGQAQFAISMPLTEGSTGPLYLRIWHGPSRPSLPTKTPTPVSAIPVSALSQPLLEHHGLTAEQINAMFQSGTLEPDQQYVLASCAINPAQKPRNPYLFSQDDNYVDSPVFSLLTATKMSLDHHACYQIAATYVGPQLWRACDGRPYGPKCPRGNHDVLWEKEIPFFTATRDNFRPIHDP